MSRLMVILAIIMCCVSFAVADDPGLPDSVIIGMVAVDFGTPSVMLPIYAVTDEPVDRFCLPFVWQSSDNLIRPASAYYFNTLLEWDFTTDTLTMNNNHIILRGTCDTGGEPNPYLNTSGDRQLIAMMRFTIDDLAEEQFCEVNWTFDPIFMQPAFYYDDDQDLIPYFISGGIFYEDVAVNEEPTIPVEYALMQNYPNPFNMDTEIAFTLPEPGNVSLEIYDILGRKIRTLTSKHYNSGYYQISWNGRNDSGQPVTSGLYFYKLQSESVSFTKKMVLLK